MEVANTVHPYEGEPCATSKDFRRGRLTKKVFSPAVFGSRLEQKIPVSKCSVCCVCVLFSMENFDKGKLP